VASSALERISAAHVEFFEPLRDETRLYVELTRRLIDANVQDESEQEPPTKEKIHDEE